MPRITRRDCIVRGATALAGIAGLGGAWRNVASANADGLKLAMILGPGEKDRAHLIRQIGVSHTIAGVSGALNKVPKSKYVDTLASIKKEYKSYGLAIDGVESHPVAADKIKLGLPGRDEEIETTSPPFTR